MYHKPAVSGTSTSKSTSQVCQNVTYHPRAATSGRNILHHTSPMLPMLLGAYATAMHYQDRCITGGGISA